MLKKDVFYRVVTQHNQEMGFAFNGNYYGLHPAEKGPLPLERKGFVIKDDNMVRADDGYQFHLEEIHGEKEALLKRCINIL